MSYDALKQYTNAALEARVAAADQHGLIAMLIDGALDKISLARTHMAHGNTAAKGTHISLAISIIEGLRSSLDLERGGEIARNLDALYDYMGHRLIAANLENNPAGLVEVAGLLSTIKSGWDTIPAELRKGH